MLTEFHTYVCSIQNDNNPKGLTVKNLTFLGGCILALLKVACSPPKKILAVNKRNLLMGSDQESLPDMPA